MTCREHEGFSRIETTVYGGEAIFFGNIEDTGKAEKVKGCPTGLEDETMG